MPRRETEVEASQLPPHFRGLKHWEEVPPRVRVEAAKYPREGSQWV